MTWEEAVLWLRAQQVRGLTDDLALSYILGGPENAPAAAKVVREQLSESHAKSINLCRTWIDSVLPHVLSRVNQVRRARACAGGVQRAVVRCMFRW